MKRKVQRKILLKSKNRRGYGKKSAKKVNEQIQNVNFSILGANANGINPKKESLYSAINYFKPIVVNIQESKLRKIGQIKLPGYQIFEKLRENKTGW